MCHEFERHGWQVEDVYLGNPMRHDEKYLLINQGFAGKQRLMPFFNRQNNDDLILAVQSAGVTRGRNGFRKDKGGEKLAETEEDLLQHRTDGTDAFDTLYIGCEKFPHREITCKPGVLLYTPPQAVILHAKQNDKNAVNHFFISSPFYSDKYGITNTPSPTPKFSFNLPFTSATSRFSPSTNTSALS